MPCSVPSTGGGKGGGGKEGRRRGGRENLYVACILPSFISITNKSRQGFIEFSRKRF